MGKHQHISGTTSDKKDPGLGADGTMYATQTPAKKKAQAPESIMKALTSSHLSSLSSKFTVQS